MGSRCGIEVNRWEVAVGYGEPNSRRGLSGENTGTGGRAKRAGGIGPGEGHAAFCEALDIWSLIELGLPMQGGVSPAEIICNNEDNVRSILGKYGSRNGPKD